MMNVHFDTEGEQMKAENRDCVTRIGDSRMLMVSGAISNELCTRASLELLRMESEDPVSGVTILLNSGGGDVQAGFMLIDTIRTLSVDVEIICTGLAASMGAMILMAGTPGKRRALAHSRVMIHQPSVYSPMMMQASDMEIQAREMQRIRRTLYEFIVECTGRPYEDVASDCERNFWMDAKEAMEYGIVDGIVTKEAR